MTLSRTAMALPAAALAMSMVAATPALACRCNEPGDASAYRDAQAVVRATVVKVAGNAVGPGGAVAELAVGAAWKSSVGERITVETSTTCGYTFETGKDYLVYLRAGGARAPYATRKCMGNTPLADAQQRVRWLQSHAKPAAAANTR